MAHIAWLVPSLIEGSGGHRTILQHADFLQSQGHRCTLYMENGSDLSSANLKKSIPRIFGFEFEDVRAGWNTIEPADMVFATIWYSARVVRDLAFPCIRCYFVQDYEALFHPMGSAHVMAENSYRYGLNPITIGRWLPARLADRFDVGAACFDFCADLDVYHPVESLRHDSYSVCFIYQPEKPRRCAELGIEALGIVKHRSPQTKIILYGSKVAGKVWFAHENRGLLGLEQCNELYNRCSVGLCISTTNPSRIPFEMMAAGLPVVEVHGDNTVYDLPQDAVALCEPTPESLAKGILDVLSDAVRAASMGQAGTRFMRGRPLAHGLEQFGDVVQSLLDGKGLPSVRPEPLYRLAPIRSSLEALAKFEIPGHVAPLQPNSGRLGFLPRPLRSVARAGVRAIRRLKS